jgi:hypothetical protein
MGRQWICNPPGKPTGSSILSRGTNLKIQMKNPTSSQQTFLAKNVCTVCKKPATDFEPRFSYFTCDAHSNVAPVNLDRARKEYKDSNECTPAK